MSIDRILFIALPIRLKTKAFLALSGLHYFKHIKIALFRFSDILPKPDVQQNFASELRQNLELNLAELELNFL